MGFSRRDAGRELALGGHSAGDTLWHAGKLGGAGNVADPFSAVVVLHGIKMDGDHIVRGDPDSRIGRHSDVCRVDDLPMRPRLARVLRYRDGHVVAWVLVHTRILSMVTLLALEGVMVADLHMKASKRRGSLHTRHCLVR